MHPESPGGGGEGPGHRGGYPQVGRQAGRVPQRSLRRKVGEKIHSLKISSFYLNFDSIIFSVDFLNLKFGYVLRSSNIDLITFL